MPEVQKEVKLYRNVAMKISCKVMIIRLLFELISNLGWNQVVKVLLGSVSYVLLVIVMIKAVDSEILHGLRISRCYRSCYYLLGYPHYCSAVLGIIGPSA